MTLHVIHKSDRTDRRELLEKEIVRQGISLVVWHEAITSYETVMENIIQSHKSVVRMAKEKGLPMVCIAEDDVWFPANDGWKYFLRNMPTSFDLYLGGIYSGKISLSHPAPKSAVAKTWAGMHLYVIHEKLYDFFLNAERLKANVETIARAALEQSGGVAKLCYPYAAVQAETESDNRKGIIYKIHDYFNSYNTYGLR